MSDYKKLKVWEDAHQFTIDIYNITKKFPNNEQYGMTSQIRRSSSSIPTNIVEGCGQLDNGNLIRFLGIAKGSAFETEYQLLLSKDLNYITNDEYKFLIAKIQSIICMLTGHARKKTSRYALRTKTKSVPIPAFSRSSSQHLPGSY
jgi:four helix bundle protein